MSALRNTGWVIYNVANNNIISEKIIRKWAACIRDLSVESKVDKHVEEDQPFLHLGVNSARFISCLSRLARILLLVIPKCCLTLRVRRSNTEPMIAGTTWTSDLCQGLVHLTTVNHVQVKSCWTYTPGCSLEHQISDSGRRCTCPSRGISIIGVKGFKFGWCTDDLLVWRWRWR